MKNLGIALLGLVFSISAQAKDLPLDKTITALRPIQGTVLGTAMQFPKCPVGAMCEPMGVVMVEFTLSGCVNDVVASSHVETLPGRKFKVVVAATELVNSESAIAMCVAIPKKTLSIPLYTLGGVDASDVSVEFTSNLLN